MHYKLLAVSLAVFTSVNLISQNVGLGTNSPGSKLSVNGNLAVGGSYATGSAPANGAAIQGAVGIGTTTPSLKLHVRDDVNGPTGIIIQNNDAGNNSIEQLIFGNEDGNLISLTAYDDGHALYPNDIRLSNTRSSGSVRFATGGGEMVLSSGGNLGIGVSSPSHKLSVSGDVNVTSGFKIGGGAGSGQYLRGNGTRFVSSALLASDLSGLIANTQLANNSVTVNAGTGLSGGGTVALGGSITLNNTGDTDASDDITTSSNAGGDLSGPFSNLQINNGAVGSAEIANGSIAAADLSNLGAGSGQSIYWNGSAWVPYTPTSGTVTGTGTANYLPKWTSASNLSSTSSVYDDGSSVGIGTNAPWAKLDVYDGDIVLGRPQAIHGATHRQYILHGAWNNLYLAPRNDANTDWQWGSAFIVNKDYVHAQLNAYVNNRLGVGTTNPQVPLSVGGNGVDVYATSAWIENNMHVQGNETLVQGGRGRMRVGTAWGYVGLYADGSSTGAANDLVLGAGSGQVRIGPNGYGQNLKVNGMSQAKTHISTDYQYRQGPGTGADNQYHQANCDQGYAMVNFSVYASDRWDGDIRMNCANLTTSILGGGWYWQGSQYGCSNVDNAQYDINCPANYLASGFYAYATGRLDYCPHLLCSPLAGGYSTTNSPGFTSALLSPWNTGGDNMTHMAACPPGTFVNGMSIYVSNYLDGALQLRCSGINFP